ncbi:MAG: VWA domain-containing protein [Burkholderiales bacterium]|nr:VWA domain-containing protein [Burkholderiales bacterium]
MSKAQFLADVANRTIHDLCLRCSATEEIRNYYDIAVIGYGSAVGPAFAGGLTGRTFIPISEVANTPARVDQRMKKVPDGAGGLVEQSVRFPVWLDPQASGGTPMCEAIRQATSLVGDWIKQHPTSFPPTILNITDGESTDGDPSGPGQELQRLRTSDGEVLVFNCHVTAQAIGKIEYPSGPDSLPNDHARALFSFSSLIPPVFRQTATQLGVDIQEGARAFVFNADPVSLAQFFEIGTRPANLR